MSMTSRLTVSAILLALPFVAPACSDPVTPGNGFIDFVLAVQVGGNDPDEFMCDELNPLASSEVGQKLVLVAEEGSPIIEIVKPDGPESAWVEFRTQLVKEGYESDSWRARMMLQDGRWLVCGLEAL